MTTANNLTDNIMNYSNPKKPNELINLETIRIGLNNTISKDKTRRLIKPFYNEKQKEKILNEIGADGYKYHKKTGNIKKLNKEKREKFIRKEILYDKIHGFSAKKYFVYTIKTVNTKVSIV